MAKTNNTPVEFIETTSTKLTTVQEEHPGAFIHVSDENGDDTLYIGDEQITDKFNIGNDNPSDQTIKVGNFKPDNYGQLQGMTVSEILREMFRPISVQSVGVSPTSKTLRVGGTVTLTATVTPSDATNATVSWSSSNTEIATVSNSGKVTAKKVGTTTINVSAGGKRTSCSITVEPTPPSVSSYNSVDISYSGRTLIGTDENLPAKTDIVSDIKTGAWSDGTPYAGTPSDIELTMTPDNWGLPGEEGTYTITGSVTFQEGGIPKDNAGNDHTTHYPGGTIVTDPITITVLTPIYINDTNIEEVTGRHLVDYRNEVNIIVTIPDEIDGTLDKFKVYLPSVFEKFEVNQYNPMTREYDRKITMVLMENEESKYIRTLDESDTFGSTEYKITLKK